TSSGCYERTSKFQHPTLLFNRQLTELFANFGLKSLCHHNLYLMIVLLLLLPHYSRRQPISVPNRDRGEPHGPTPPTPSYLRVTYTAVRQIKSTALSIGASSSVSPAEVSSPKSNRRMRYFHSSTIDFSSLLIPSRAAVRAVSSRRC